MLCLRRREACLVRAKWKWEIWYDCRLVLSLYNQPHNILSSIHPGSRIFFFKLPELRQFITSRPLSCIFHLHGNANARVEHTFFNVFIFALGWHLIEDDRCNIPRSSATGAFAQSYELLPVSPIQNCFGHFPQRYFFHHYRQSRIPHSTALPHIVLKPQKELFRICVIAIISTRPQGGLSSLIKKI